MIQPGDIDTRQPYLGESLYGFLADVTAANGLIRIGLITGDAERYGHRPQLATAARDDLQPVAEMLEVDVDELEHRSYQIVDGDTARRTFFGTTVAKADIRTRTRFFSPAALAKQPFHQAMWQLRIPFDIETGEILVSECRFCRRVQRWRHAAGIDCCDSCGDSLEQITDRIDDEILPEVALAVGLTHTDPTKRGESLALLPAEISCLGAATAFEMLLRLVPVTEAGCTWSKGYRLWGNDPHAIASGMCRAWRMMLAWPGSMSERINQDLTTSGTRHSDGNRGQTIRFLGLRNLEYLPQSLRDVIQRIHASIDTAGPNGAALRAKTMTCGEVGKVLSYGTAQVVALRRRGAFRTIGAARGSLMVPLFDRDEVMLLERDKRHRRDLDQSNAVLGLPYYAIEQLSALGRIPLLKHPFFTARFTAPQTTSTALEELIDLLMTARSPTQTGWVPMLDAMHMVGGRLKPWDAVIEAMLDGDLPYSLTDGPTAVFERVRVDRECLRGHLATPITRNGAITPLTGRIDPHFPYLDLMSKVGAAEVLNLAVRQATRLLSAFPTTNQPIIPIEEVERIAYSHVTNIEIASSLGVPHQTVRSAARALGIRQSSDAGYERIYETKIVAAVKLRLGDAMRAKR